MAKFELTIDVKYLPEWHVWEGIRELIQNGKDAEVEHQAPLTVDWKNGTLRIENDGAVLSREALLFGHTTKLGHAELIGKFGEGLKLGILALVRAGRAVKIRSGDEVWTPTIARSERYNASVLTFDIKGGNENKKRVRVEISGVIEEEWLDFRSRFLFLKDKRESDKSVVKTPEGDLLTHEKYQGKLYVKGIFVCNMPGLIYGYNFHDAELDRDRKMIDGFDRERRMANILNHAVAARPDLLDGYFEILEDLESKERAGINKWRLPDDVVIDAAVKRFRSRFGDDAVPVLSLAESQDVEHFGVRGIVVTDAMQALLQRACGNAETVKGKFAKSTVREFSYGDLTYDERTALFDAIETVSAACSLTEVRKRVHIVEFRDEKLQGLHHGERVEIARKLLNDEYETLRVLVHELAHDSGVDGEKSHVAQIERLWTSIVRYLHTSKKTG